MKGRLTIFYSWYLFIIGKGGFVGKNIIPLHFKILLILRVISGFKKSLNSFKQLNNNLCQTIKK